jgi:RNA polymerase sigma-70 factor (ECF subfamily)
MTAKRDSAPEPRPAPAERERPLRASGTALVPARLGDPGAVPRTKSDDEWREHLGVVYRANAKPLLTLFRAEKVADPESLLHDVLLEASDYLRQPQDPKSIPALLATIARRRISDDRRIAKRRPGARPDPEVLVSGDPDQEQALYLARRSHALDLALQSMPPASAALVEEVDLDGGSPKEIAQRIGVSEGAVRTRVSRARSLLAELFLRLHGTDRGE